MIDERAAAPILGGEYINGAISCPGPGHSRKDRSLRVWLLTTTCGGVAIYVHSLAGDPWATCKEDVARRLNLPQDYWRHERRVEPAEMKRWRRARREAAERDRAEAHRREQRAAGIVTASRPATAETLTAAYLEKWRRLSLPASTAILDNSACPWERGTAPCMVGAYRDIVTGALCGVHRTRLDPDTAEKAARKMFGRSRGAAIMIDPLAGSDTLHIAEGVETALAGREHFGLSPIWALGSSGAIAAFPVLDAVKRLVVVAENDRSGASAAAVETVGNRWHATGRTVEIIWPDPGFIDLNDMVMGSASA